MGKVCNAPGSAFREPKSGGKPTFLTLEVLYSVSLSLGRLSEMHPRLNFDQLVVGKAGLPPLVFERFGSFSITPYRLISSLHLLNNHIGKLSGPGGAANVFRAHFAFRENLQHRILRPVRGFALAQMTKHENPGLQ